VNTPYYLSNLTKVGKSFLLTSDAVQLTTYFSRSITFGSV